MAKELSHAEQNATGWAEGIATAWEAARFCADEGQGRYLSQAAKAVLRELGYDGTNHAQILEAIEEQSREQPLSVEVRNDWHAPGKADEDGPDEFCILLSTGGPALRIRGELNHGEPYRCWLEHQDWGTPWTRFFDADGEALLWFAGLFWYGDD